MADRWLLVEEPRQSKDTVAYSGFALRRCGYDDRQAAYAEEQEQKRCIRDNEVYKPREWRRPLYIGMELHLGSAKVPVTLVMRSGGPCLAITGRFRTVVKDGKRKKVWKEFGQVLHQPLNDARLLGKSKVKIPSAPKGKKAKVAA